MNYPCCCYPCYTPYCPPWCTLCYVPYVVCRNTCQPAAVQTRQRKPKLTDFSSPGAPSDNKKEKPKRKDGPKTVKQKKGGKKEKKSKGGGGGGGKKKGGGKKEKKDKQSPENGDNPNDENQEKTAAAGKGDETPKAKGKGDKSKDKKDQKKDGNGTQQLETSGSGPTTMDSNIQGAGDGSRKVICKCFTRGACTCVHRPQIVPKPICPNPKCPTRKPLCPNPRCPSRNRDYPGSVHLTQIGPSGSTPMSPNGPLRHSLQPPGSPNGPLRHSLQPPGSPNGPLRHSLQSPVSPNGPFSNPGSFICQQRSQGPNSLYNSRISPFPQLPVSTPVSAGVRTCSCGRKYNVPRVNLNAAVCGTCGSLKTKSDLSKTVQDVCFKANFVIGGSRR